MIYRLSETLEAEDSHPEHPTGSRGEIFAETDDLDFDLPGIDKTISHITVYYRAKEWTGNADLEVGISSNSGWDWTTDTKALSFAVSKERFKHFFFEAAAAERWRLRLRVPSGNTMHYELIRIIVSYIPLCEVEAVER
jgi:hypothetical protein